jgi:subtilisin family serine protease
MLTFTYGGKGGNTYRLAEAGNLLVVRSEKDILPVHSKLTAKGRATISSLMPVATMASAGVQVFAATTRDSSVVRRGRVTLKKEPELRFAGTALKDPDSGAPVVYTENVFVKFRSGVAESRCRSLLSKYRLSIKRELPYASVDGRNVGGGIVDNPGRGAAFFTGAPEGIGTRIFTLSAELLREEEVELCHPELVRQMSYRAVFPQQWHLKATTINSKVINAHANVEAAWAVTEGSGVTLAVIDDGFDADHEELRSVRKIVAPHDATRHTNDPSPGRGDMHGHSCAGVAAADGLHGASGVAPKAKLMPIRLASALGSQNEGDAFAWAVDNGADVISCSWGPADGDWWRPSDPLHKQKVPLPDSTRLAIDYAVTRGRGGEGCVVVWAAGNGNESVDNDGYASYPSVVAVAACNDKGKRSAYSDKGKAIWCAFPSDDGNPSLTPGIWTTDLSGKAGYNDGNVSKGDAAGNYTNSFGGTSSAAPGAAGVAALVLSKNPRRGWQDVKDILKNCCDRIDVTGGKYDAKGHSKKYGYGRLNARKAVDLA